MFWHTLSFPGSVSTDTASKVGTKNYVWEGKRKKKDEGQWKPKLIPGQKMKQRGLMVQKPSGMPSLSKAIYPQPLKASLW